MKTDLDHLDDFAEELASLRPAALDANLAHRLEMTLHQADEERSKPKNIIYHPFFQRAMAAAALFVALLMAVQTTQVASPGVGELADVSVAQEAESAPVKLYQVMGGELVEVSDNSALKQASYRGVSVIDGRAYRVFTNPDTGKVLETDVARGERASGVNFPEMFEFLPTSIRFQAIAFAESANGRGKSPVSNYLTINPLSRTGRGQEIETSVADPQPPHGEPAPDPRG